MVAGGRQGDFNISGEKLQVSHVKRIPKYQEKAFMRKDLRITTENLKNREKLTINQFLAWFWGGARGGPTFIDRTRGT